MPRKSRAAEAPAQTQNIDNARRAVLDKAVGDILKRRCAGSQAFVLVPHGPLAKGIGLRPSRRIPLFNGAIDCRLLCFDLFEGSHLR
jgi:putative N6-adenine-specific DNA methylase